MSDNPARCAVVRASARVLKGAVIDQLVFEAAPEGLDEGVIVAITCSTHGSDQAVLGQDLAVSGAGELHAAIGVHDQAFSGCRWAKAMRSSERPGVGRESRYIRRTLYILTQPAANLPRFRL